MSATAISTTGTEDLTPAWARAIPRDFHAAVQAHQAGEALPAWANKWEIGTDPGDDGTNDPFIAYTGDWGGVQITAGLQFGEYADISSRTPTLWIKDFCLEALSADDLRGLGRKIGLAVDVITADGEPNESGIDAVSASVLAKGFMRTIREAGWHDSDGLTEGRLMMAMISLVAADR